MKKKNNRNIPGFVTRKYTLELDLTEVLVSLLRNLGKKDEKDLLHWVILGMSRHQKEIVDKLTRIFPEVWKRIMIFHQKRVEDHRKSMRAGKVFSFRSWSSVEDEAVRKAWIDTREMIREMSLLRDESFRGLINDHREILRRLSGALVDLVLEDPGALPEIDPGALEKLLG